MIEIALRVLKKIEEHGYNAYIVGGFVRDYLLERSSKDVDIATNATPKEIKEIFLDACLSNEDYGSVSVLYKKIRFEITTYRKDLSYQDYRRPASIVYVDDLLCDLERRDFTINAICMNQEKKIIDPMNGIYDLHHKLIRVIGDPQEKFQEDVLRILRAIRFATTLNFSLETQTREAILHTKHLLANLSLQRKKEELNKIFSNPNVMYGIELIKKLHLVEELELSYINKVKYCTQVIGFWTLLEVDDIYPFTRHEKKLMRDIRIVIKKGPLSKQMLYQYGLYICSIAGELVGTSKKDILEAYQSLPIYKRSDLDVSTSDILNFLNVPSGAFLNTLYVRLESLVLEKKVLNQKEKLLLACKQIYPVIV